MPYDIRRTEENEEVLIEDSNYGHLISENQVNKICKSKRQKKTPPTKKNDFFYGKPFFKHKETLDSDINCNDKKFRPHLQKKKLLTIYQQNICGLSNKINELLSFLHPYFADVLCLTEHQLKQAQLELAYLDNYHLGAGYCRQD